jgi:hypothetical protein
MSHLIASDERGAIGIRDLLVMDRQIVAATLSLQKGVVVTGSTRDSTTGRPLPWVRVRAYQGSSFTVGLQDDVSAVSDAGGAFRFLGLPSGSYVFEAVRFGFLRTVQTHVLETGARPYDVSILLTREARIEGRVIDAAGQPVLGAAVILKESNPVQEFARQLRAGRRDAPGTYTDRASTRSVERRFPAIPSRRNRIGDRVGPHRCYVDAPPRRHGERTREGRRGPAAP